MGDDFDSEAVFNIHVDRRSLSEIIVFKKIFFIRFFFLIYDFRLGSFISQICLHFQFLDVILVLVPNLINFKGT